MTDEKLLWMCGFITKEPEKVAKGLYKLVIYYGVYSYIERLVISVYM